jgi:hypothetical protein
VLELDRRERGRPEGWFITIKDRPGDARVLPQSEFGDVPLLREIAIRMQKLASDAEAEGRPITAPPPPPATPLEGMPAEHPELGSLVFTFKVPLRSRVGQVISLAGLAVFFTGIAGCVALGPKAGGDVAGRGGALLGILLVVVGSALSKTTGTDFCAYEKGIANKKSKLAWSEVSTISLSSVNQRGKGTEHLLVLAGPDAQRFRMSGWGPAAEAFLGWFGRNVVSVVAKRDLETAETTRPSMSRGHWGRRRRTSCARRRAVRSTGWTPPRSTSRRSCSRPRRSSSVYPRCASVRCRGRAGAAPWPR